MCYAKIHVNTDNAENDICKIAYIWGFKTLDQRIGLYEMIRLKKLKYKGSRPIGTFGEVGLYIYLI
jgi:hypothetical protein